MIVKAAGPAVFVFALALGAAAQSQQTVQFAADSDGITGGARSGCIQNDWWLNSSVRSIRFTWTDTTNSKPGNVRVEASFRWGHYGRGDLAVDVDVNDVLQPEPLVSPNTQPGSCGLNQVTTSTHEDGVSVWNPLGQNSLVFTIPPDVNAVFSSAGPWIAQIVVTALNQPPDPPSLLAQIDLGGKSMTVGATTAFKGAELRASVTDPDGDPVFLEVEVQPTTVFFTGVPTAAGLPVGSGSTAAAIVAGLSDLGHHWQVRAVDPSGERSAWVSFGANSEVAADFKVDTTIQAATASNDGMDHGGGDCALSAGPAGTGTALLTIALALGWLILRRAA